MPGFFPILGVMAARRFGEFSSIPVVLPFFRSVRSSPSDAQWRVLDALPRITQPCVPLIFINCRHEAEDHDSLRLETIMSGRETAGCIAGFHARHACVLGVCLLRVAR